MLVLVLCVQSVSQVPVSTTPSSSVCLSDVFFSLHVSRPSGSLYLFLSYVRALPPVSISLMLLQACVSLSPCFPFYFDSLASHILCVQIASSCLVFTFIRPSCVPMFPFPSSPSCVFRCLAVFRSVRLSVNLPRLPVFPVCLLYVSFPSLGYCSVSCSFAFNVLFCIIFTSLFKRLAFC